MVNSKVSMTQQQWKDLVYNHIDIDTVDGKMMACLAHLPDLMQRGRRALRSQPQPISTLLDLQKEGRALREAFEPNMKSLRERWKDTDSNVAVQYPKYAYLNAIIHAHFSRSYGMALAVGIILNCILAALEKNTDGLREESSHLSEEILHLAEVVDQYRPLGTLYMLFSLVAAWVGATDPIRKEMVRICLNGYQRDIQGELAKTTSSTDLESLERRFYLK